MEQNKVLMVIVSVAIFFAAIIGVGVALLYPRSEEQTQTADGSVVREFDPIEYVRRPEDAPLEAEQTDDEDVIIVYGDNGDEPTQEPDAEQRAGEEDTQISGGEDERITITREPAPEPERSERAPTPAPEPQPTPTPAPDRRSAEPTPEPAQPDAAAAGQADEPEPRRIRVTEYWIQLIASPHRDRVERARTTLADHSLGGRVTTRDVDGELFYRLRVGPYESRDEAEKFLDWIQEIEGFGGAYISEEYPVRTVQG